MRTEAFSAGAHSAMMKIAAMSEQDKTNLLAGGILLGTPAAGYGVHQATKATVAAPPAPQLPPVQPVKAVAKGGQATASTATKVVKAVGKVL